ncbi:MAG: hypothetical protein NC090_06755 [Anaeroplasma bactoclasticum]|nr:hypothetical protein [Anaeroplasma bactoclasticum]
MIQQIERTNENKHLLRNLYSTFKIIQLLDEGNKLAETIKGLAELDYKAIDALDQDLSNDGETLDSAFYRQESFNDLANKIKGFCSYDHLNESADTLAMLLFGYKDSRCINEVEIMKLETFLNEGDNNND